MTFSFEAPSSRKGEFGWLDDLNREAIRDGDSQEEYHNDQLVGIKAVVTRIEGKTTVTLRKEVTGGGSSQYYKEFKKGEEERASSLFAELKNLIDVSSAEGYDKEDVFRKAESLFV